MLSLAQGHGWHPCPEKVEGVAGRCLSSLSHNESYAMIWHSYAHDAESRFLPDKLYIFQRTFRWTIMHEAAFSAAFFIFSRFFAGHGGGALLADELLSCPMKSLASMQRATLARERARSFSNQPTSPALGGYGGKSMDLPPRRGWPF